MTIYNETITNEYLNASRTLVNFKNDLRKLPKGTIQKKHIGKSNYLYLCYREDGKVKTKYIKNEEFKILDVLLKRRDIIREAIPSIEKKKEALEFLVDSSVLNDEERITSQINGVLSFDTIVIKLSPIFKSFGIRKAVLFGSYAKGNEKEASDIDIMVDTEIKGLDFFEFVEAVRDALKKEIDIIPKYMIKKDSEIAKEIEKTGVDIYNE